MIFQFNWLLFSWVLFHKKISMIKQEYSANDLSKTSNTTKCGNDIRISFEDEEDKMLSKIRNNKLKWNQLQLLENPHISIFEKLFIIKEIENDNVESMYVSNIHKGGLWKDWD